MPEEKPKHPTHVEGWNGTLEELVVAVKRMRYDKVAEFAGYWAKHTEAEAEKDAADGKVKLPRNLFAASELLYRVQEEYDSAWKISKPHMDDEKSE